MINEKGFNTFTDFYPFCLGEHTNRTSRQLHFMGISFGILMLLMALVTQMWWLGLAGFVQGYAFAWISHFFFEHNKPATFKYPRFSFIGDRRL